MATTFKLIILAFATLTLQAHGLGLATPAAPDERMDVIESASVAEENTTASSSYIIEDSIAENTTTDAPPHGRNLLSTPCKRRRSAAWLASHPRKTGPKEAHHDRPRLPWCDEVDQEAVVVAAASAAPAAPVYSRTLSDRAALKAAVAECNIINPDTGFGRVWNTADTVNCDIATWDVSAVTSFQSIFFSVDFVDFNEDISNWDVSKGTSFAQMFDGAANFNQDISKWDVSQSATFNYMFRGASNFNQDITKWDVSKSSKFQEMFKGAVAFDYDITVWEDPLASEEWPYYSANMFQGATAFLAKYARPDGGSDYTRSPHGPISRWSPK